MTRRAIRRAVCCLSVSLVGIFAVIFFSPLVKWTAGKLAVDWYEGDGDVLIVLGGSMLVPGTGPRAALGYDSYLRAVYAGWTLSGFHYPLVVVCGDEGVAEALSASLQANGVPANSILLERRSRSTEENAMYVRELLREHSISPELSRIVILTSDFHCFRARATFAKRGIAARVIPVPDVAKRSGYVPYRLEGFVTVTEELSKTAFYWLTGKM